jgi:hypothetical protein
MSYLSSYGWSNLGHPLARFNSSIFFVPMLLIEPAPTQIVLFCVRICMQTICILCAINVIGVHVVCIVCAACVHAACATCVHLVCTLPFAEQRYKDPMHCNEHGNEHSNSMLTVKCQPSIVQRQHPQGQHGGGGGGDPAGARPGRDRYALSVHRCCIAKCFARFT